MNEFEKNGDARVTGDAEKDAATLFGTGTDPNINAANSAPETVYTAEPVNAETAHPETPGMWNAQENSAARNTNTADAAQTTGTWNGADTWNAQTGAQNTAGAWNAQGAPHADFNDAQGGPQGDFPGANAGEQPNFAGEGAGGNFAPQGPILQNGGMPGGTAYMPGLLHIFIGLIISLSIPILSLLLSIPEALNSMTEVQMAKNGNFSMEATGSVWTVLFTFVQIACELAVVILIAVGLGEMKKFAPHFKKAFTVYIANIIVTVVGSFLMVIIAIVAFSRAVWSEAFSSADDVTLHLETVLTGLNVILIGVLLLSIVYIILEYIYFKNLMIGCAGVSYYYGNRELENKCHSVWKLWRIYTVVSSIVLMLTVSAMLFFMNKIIFDPALNNKLRNLSMDDFFQVFPSRIVIYAVAVSVIVVLLLFALSIFSYVVRILGAVRLHRVYALYGKKVE